MRAKDFITEAFDRPYAFNWSRGDHGDYDVFVKLPDGSPLNIAFNHEGDDGWHVAFDRGHSQDITGAGDAQRIFATVLTSIQQFIGKEHPEKLYFSASKDVYPGQNPESRSSLYERMVHRYADALGYDVVVDDRRGQATYILNKKSVAENLTQEDRHPNDPPYGPETKPTMPKGTVRVDVSDVYDWYKLGMHISDLDGLGKHDFGKGPPSTIFSFGNEETEHKYIKDLEKTGLTTTDIDPKDPNQPKGMPRQKTDPTFNVNEEESSKPTMGINVRSDGDIDYAGLIIDGQKKYESRQTDSLRPYVGKTVAIVRTGKGSAVAIGQVTVGEPVVVDAEKFDKMRDQHLVPQGSKFDIDPGATKYLYPMIDPVRWDREKLVKQKGIVARKIDDLDENFADGKVKGKSRPGRVKRAGASCNGSVTDLRARAKKASGELAKMYHWCANMKSGRKK